MNLETLKNRSETIRVQYEGKYHVKWPQDFKKDVVALLESGESLANLKEATGIARQTIELWQNPSKKSRRKKSKFQEVVVAGVGESEIVLKWSEGLEVRGLSFAQFSDLLERGIL